MYINKCSAPTNSDPQHKCGNRDCRYSHNFYDNGDCDDCFKPIVDTITSSIVDQYYAVKHNTFFKKNHRILDKKKYILIEDYALRYFWCDIGSLLDYDLLDELDITKEQYYKIMKNALKPIGYWGCGIEGELKCECGIKR